MSLHRIGELIAKVSKHVLTSADGDTYAVGRVLGVAFGFVGAPLPYVMLQAGKDVSLVDAGVYYGALATAIAGLIRLTNSTEPPVAAPAE